MDDKIFAKRMREAMDEKNMTSAELCRITGIGKSAISAYRSGKYLPKQNNTYFIAKALGVSPAWLMGGNTKYVESTANEQHEVPVTPEEEALLSDFRKLNNAGRAIAAATIKSLATNPEYTEKETATYA